MMTKVEKMMNKRKLMNEWTVEIHNLNDSVFCLNRPFTALSHKYSFHNKKMNLATAIFISLIPKNIRKERIADYNAQRDFLCNERERITNEYLKLSEELAIMGF